MRRFFFILLLALHLAGGPVLAAVPVVTPEVTYTANGSATSYAYAFLIFDKTDLVVKVDGVTQTITDDYTVTGVGEASGGTVDFVVAPGSGDAVTITRAIPMDRTTDYTTSGPLRASTLNKDLDRIVSQAQDRERRLSQAEADITTNAGGLTTEITNRTNADAALQTQVTTNANGLAAEITNRTSADTDLQSQITSNDGELALSLKFPSGDSSSPTLPDAGTRASKLLAFDVAGDLALADQLVASQVPIGEALSQYDSEGRLTGTNIVHRVPTLDKLREVAGTTGRQTVYLEGRTSRGDGGQGLFRWDSSDLSAEVTDQIVSGTQTYGKYVAPESDTTGASGAWVLQDTGPINPRRYGAVGDYVISTATGTDDYLAIQSALNTGEDVILENGVFYTSTPLLMATVDQKLVFSKATLAINGAYPAIRVTTTNISLIDPRIEQASGVVEGSAVQVSAGTDPIDASDNGNVQTPKTSGCDFRGVEKGFHLIAVGSARGIVSGEFSFKRILGVKYPFYFETSSGGWINANRFYGAYILNNTTIAGGSTLYINHAGLEINANVFGPAVFEKQAELITYVSSSPSNHPVGLSFEGYFENVGFTNMNSIGGNEIFLKDYRNRHVFQQIYPSTRAGTTLFKTKYSGGDSDVSITPDALQYVTGSNPNRFKINNANWTIVHNGVNEQYRVIRAAQAGGTLQYTLAALNTAAYCTIEVMATRDNAVFSPYYFRGVMAVQFVSNTYQLTELDRVGFSVGAAALSDDGTNIILTITAPSAEYWRYFLRINGAIIFIE